MCAFVCCRRHEIELNGIEFYFRLHCKRNDRLHPLITNMISIQGGYAVVYLLCTTRGPLYRLVGAESIWDQQQVFFFFNQLSSLGWIYKPNPTSSRQRVCFYLILRRNIFTPPLLPKGVATYYSVVSSDRKGFL